MPEPAETLVPPDPPHLLVRTWALAIGLLALAKGISFVEPSGLLAGNLAGVAAFLFVFLSDRRLRARGEPWDLYGLPFHGLGDARTWRAWARGAGAGLLVCAIVFPPFVLAFWGFSFVLPHLPEPLAEVVVPYSGAPRFALRAPDRLGVMIAVQLLAVALPEELFYRGWMQTSWARGAPGRGVTVLGARLGAGFVWTQLLFAAGHLVVLQPWRLATFFPGLLFGWVRERTGGLVAPVVVHAASNLLIATLEASFYR